MSILGAREYVAALCHWQDGGLVPYDSERFFAENEAEARRKADEWAIPSLGVITEKTWLQVTSDGRCIHSRAWGDI